MIARKFPNVSKLPLLLIYSISLSIYYFSWTFYAGLLIIFGGAILNFFNTKVLAKMMKKINLLKDAKLNAVTEFIYNIKIIKLYSWIDTFEQRVKEARNKEVRAWYIRYFATVLNVFFNTGVASLIIIG